jgi:hypothetical protein
MIEDARLCSHDPPVRPFFLPRFCWLLSRRRRGSGRFLGALGASSDGVEKGVRPSPGGEDSTRKNMIQ